MNLYAGDERKTPKYVQNENQGKIPRLVALPSPRLRKWRPTVFRCPKTSRTYPRWDLIGALPSDALVDVYLWKRANPLCKEYNIYI